MKKYTASYYLHQQHQNSPIFQYIAPQTPNCPYYTQVIEPLEAIYRSTQNKVIGNYIFNYYYHSANMTQEISNVPMNAFAVAKQLMQRLKDINENR